MSTAPISLESIHTLRLTDRNRFGCITPTAVLELFQDVATEHVNELDIGMETLNAQGLAWVVVRTKIELMPAAWKPQPQQRVRVRTWPHSLSRLQVVRDYTLSTLDGELLAKGSSEWVILDFASKKFADVRQICGGDQEFCEDRAFEDKLRKVRDGAFEDVAPIATVVPQFTDLDTNGHVNNARYANFIVNALTAVDAPSSPAGFGRVIKSLQIDYRKELAAGDNVELFVVENADGSAGSAGSAGSSLVKGVISAGEKAGTTTFCGLVEWA